MISVLLTAERIPFFAIFSLIVFLGFFLGVLVWSFMHPKILLEEKSRIPFSDCQEDSRGR